jgi:murein L,D-transpeptidase YcbB/YkuD
VKVSINYLSLLLVFSFFVQSCNNQNANGGLGGLFKPEVIDIDALNSGLRSDSLVSVASYLGSDSSLAFAEVEKIYSDKKSKWFNKSGFNSNAQELLEQIKLSKSEGLSPEDYHFSFLDSVAQNIDKVSVLALQEAEFKTSHAFLKFAKHLLLGKVKPLSIDKNWQNKNDTTWNVDSLLKIVSNQPMKVVIEQLRPAHPWYKKFRQSSLRLDRLNQFNISKSELPEHLEIGDSSSKVRALRSILSKVADSSLDQTKMVWDTDSRNALTDYQRKYGIQTTGQFDSATIASLTQESSDAVKRLGMNMERMRWLQRDFLNEFIWVNIPQMEVNYFENDTVTFNMRAVVGRLSRKTPTLDSKLSNIVFNPPWYVPPTILKQEVLPGIMRRGGSYLARRGLVARDRRGRKINPSRINSKNYRRYSISQNPGRNSALGSVKFNFPNKEAIFLHDTNHRGDFGKKYRAFSSGCIRVHHPKDFASFILRDSTYNSEGIESVIKKRATKSVKLKRDIGVHIVYLTNAVDSMGNVVRVKDVYKWDKKLAARL